MAKDKTGFGALGAIGSTKWDIFQKNNQPVSVIYEGVRYCGLVKKINQSLNYVTLQPSILMSAYGTEAFIKDKPIQIPFDAIPSSIKEETLEEHAKALNKAKFQERILKGESIIILPSFPRFKI